jgi:hypothetical protein
MASSVPQGSGPQGSGPQGSGPQGQRQMNTQELAFWVRNWVHYDTLASGLYRQTINARRVREEFETKILNSLKASNMENAVIQIAGGRLVIHEERHNQPLTLGRIEDLLHSYFVSKNLPDETQNMMKHFRKQREYEVHKKLKKQNGPIAPLPPLPPVPPIPAPTGLK